METGPGAAASGYPTSRVEAFSDGVLAIAITLLVLDLRAPEAHGQFRQDLVAQWPSYLAYLAAFAIVGSVWINHHALLARVRSVDGGLLGRNLLLLLATSLLPFPTATVSNAWREGDSSDKVMALGVFALVSLMMSASFLGMCLYLGRHPNLLVADEDASFARVEVRRGLVAMSMTVVAFLCSFISPLLTLAMYAVLPVFYLATLRQTAPRHPTSTG